MLQMTANYVEYVVFEGKAVAEATFVPHSRHEHILTLCNLVANDSAYFFQMRLFHEADEEHLVHAYVPMLLVNIFETFVLQVQFKLLNSCRYL